MADQDLKGVRGWLLLLVFCLAVLDPGTGLGTLFTVASSSQAYFAQHPQYFRLVLVTGILKIGLMVFSLYAGVSLWRVVPGAVAAARRYLVLLCLYSLVSLALPALLGVKDMTPSDTAMNVASVGLTMAYAIAWYLYLGRSRRVRATYLTQKHDLGEA